MYLSVSLIFITLSYQTYAKYMEFVANIYTCTRPHPLYHARTPQHATRPQGHTYDDTILAGVVSKIPKI